MLRRLNIRGLGNKPAGKWRLVLAEVLAVIVGAALFVTAFGPGVYEVHGVNFAGRIRPALDGRTVLEIPPLGSLVADTHRGPIELHITLQSIRPEIGENLYPRVDPDLFRDMEVKSRSVVTAFLAKHVVLGGLGAGLLFWAVARPPLRRLCRAAVFGAVLVGLVLGAGMSTYDRTAFREPEYHGVIAAAPRVMHVADELLNKLQDFQDKSDLLVSNINTLFGQAQRLALLEATEEESTRRLLIISDVHNNPFGLDFVESLAAHFHVDLILDAGDLTDFGSPLEARAAAKVAGFGIPYLFAPGNHESPQVTEFMRALPEVYVLDGEVITVRGVSIAGSADPLARAETVAPETPEQEQLLIDQQTAELNRVLEAAQPPPDVLVVHHPDVARTFAGEVPVVISGHTHRVLVEELAGGSWHLNPGTTGAAGLRGLQTAAEVPYSALILHFDSAQGCPVAADVIKYNALSGSFTVERRLLGAPPSDMQLPAP